MLGLFKRARHHLALGAWVFLSCWAFGTNARAQTTSKFVKFDAKLYDPVVSPHGILGVHTSRALGHLSLYGQLSFNYANDEVLAQQGSGANRRIAMRPIGHRVAAELGFAFGLFDWVELAVSLPVYLYQERSGLNLDAGAGQWQRVGLDQSTGEVLVGDLRFLAKVRLMDNARFAGFGLGVLLEMSAPTGSANALSGDASITFTPQLIADYRHPNGIAIALNIGARLRTVPEDAFFGALRIGQEFRVALGAEVPIFFSRISVIGEFQLAAGHSSGTTLEQMVWSSEARTGVRWRHDSGVILTGGFGLGINAGFGSPDWRVFLDIRFGRNFKTGKPEPMYPDHGTKQSPIVVQGKPATRRPPPTRRVVARRAPPPRRPTVRVPPPQKTVVLSAAAFDRASAADPDPDGDGIPNSRDRCPNKPEDFDKFQDEDGCPELDNDKDGIPDIADKCPLRPETINGVDDDDGCPDKGKSKVTIVKGQIKIDEKVYFNSGSDKLKSRSFSILKQVASFIKASGQIHKILIEGHTDSRGDKEMNVDLSERRARRVLAFLIKEGVLRKKLKAKGFGPKIPIATNRTGRGRALNRRVAFRVLGVKSATPSKGAK